MKVQAISAANRPRRWNDGWHHGDRARRGGWHHGGRGRGGGWHYGGRGWGGGLKRTYAVDRTGTRVTGCCAGGVGAGRAVYHRNVGAARWGGVGCAWGFVVVGGVKPRGARTAGGVLLDGVN